MSNTGKVIGGVATAAAIIGGVVLYKNYAGKSDAAKNLKFSTAGITPRGMKNGNANADLILEVRNNRTSSLTITSIDLAILKDGKSIGKVIQYPSEGFQKYEISGNKISAITVPISFSVFQSIGGAIKSFADAWRGTAPFSKQVENMFIKGEIKAEGMIFKIDLPLYYA